MNAGKRHKDKHTNNAGKRHKDKHTNDAGKRHKDKHTNNAGKRHKDMHTNNTYIDNNTDRQKDERKEKNKVISFINHTLYI